MGTLCPVTQGPLPAPPEQLLTGDPAAVLEGWSDKDITPERIERLVNRGAALALALDKWLNAGLWVMTRSEADYPARLKHRLKLDSPPLLFGCGNPKLLNRGGLAVVGSRDADADDLEFSRGLGRLAAERVTPSFPGAPVASTKRPCWAPWRRRAR